jgi:hypothetical protein
VAHAIFEMTAAEAGDLALRAYGFNAIARRLEVEAALDVDDHRELLVGTLNQLVDDHNMLERFVARTGFTLEHIYAARRKLIQLTTNLIPPAAPRSPVPGRGAEHSPARDTNLACSRELGNRLGGLHRAQ